jgi:ABC-type uncharacterized transport system involved in gliding motility auxiliary subunit
MEGGRQRTYALTSLVLLLVIFIAAIMASNTLLRGFRLDLTEDRLYTLAAGTREMLDGIEEPVNLYLFFSDRETADVQFLRSYATRVTEMLEEFVAAADGNLTLQIIDPVPFSEDEDRAAEFGLTDIRGGLLGDSIYFGMAATNTVGDEAVIEVFDPAKEPALEYDLARLIYSLSTPEKTVVGLLSGAPITGGFDPQTQQPSQPWTIVQQVRQLFEVRELASGMSSIEEDIGVLWIVHPSGLDDTTLYAIDQFVMRGGRALVFVDPLAETVPPAAPGPLGMSAGSNSDLGRLFDAWGIEFDAGQIVADNGFALSINTGQTRRPVRHIGYIGLEAGAMAGDDLVTADLASLNLATAGSLSAAADASITLTPLLQSSAESAEMPAARFQMLGDPGDLLQDFTPTPATYVLAARVQGPLTSAFPDGVPEGSEADAASHVSATDNANMIVVADVDMLNDMLWVSRQRGFLGQQLLTAFANNGDFVTNAIGNLAGSEHLIGLKSRAGFARPFDRVETLRRDADARFRTTEQQLQAQLADTEQRLGELQAARDDAGSLLMTPEQQAELDRFRAEQLRIRQELRAVQRELDSSIEGLGTALKLINIIIVPLVLALLALAAYLVRRTRRRTAT